MPATTRSLARFALAVLPLCGCHAPALSTSVPRERAPEPAQPERIAAADVRITLARSECYGNCPVYSVTVDGAGNVEYEGTRFVSLTGRHGWKVNPEIVQHLVKLLERVHFLELEFDCGESITDVPTQTITLRVGTREHELANRWGAGVEFQALGGGWSLDPDLDVHALLDWLAHWIDIALDTAPYVSGAKPR